MIPTKRQLDYWKRMRDKPSNRKSIPLTLEQKKKISETLKIKGIKPPSQKGKRNTKVSEKNRTRIISDETRIKMRDAQRGEKSHLWKGGITPIHQRIRSSAEYRLWREAVFKRDNYTCRFCGKRGVVLNADHIKPFAFFPELRFAIDNGRTLCKECHKKTETYGNRSKIKSARI